MHVKIYLKNTFLISRIFVKYFLFLEFPNSSLSTKPFARNPRTSDDGPWARVSSHGTPVRGAQRSTGHDEAYHGTWW